MRELDNPIWASLTEGHSAMARKNGDARRYPSDVSPLAALKEPSASAFSDLSALVGPEESVGLFTVKPLQTPGDWRIVRSRVIEQMICTRSVGPSPAPFPTLSDRDVPEMTALAAATEPGPFVGGNHSHGRIHRNSFA